MTIMPERYSVAGLVKAYRVSPHVVDAAEGRKGPLFNISYNGRI